MLTLPGRFRREKENAARTPFALAYVEGAGVEDGATTEEDWGAGVNGKQAESNNVDYTSSPPTAGDVILAEDSGTTHESAPRRPTSDGTTIDALGPPPDAWALVDDETPDDASTQILNGALGTRVNTFNFTPFTVPSHERIASVTIYIRSASTGGTSWTEYGVLRIGGTDYTSDNNNVFTSATWTTRTYSFANDPSDSNPWTAAKVATIQEFGSQQSAGSGFALSTTQIYAVIVYNDFQTSGFMKVELDLTGANTENDMIVSVDDIVPDGTTLIHELFYPTGSTDSMAPTGHNDIGGDTVNESNAYDGNDTTFSTTTPAGSAERFYVGRTSGNIDAWESEITDVGKITLYCIAERIAGSVDLTLRVEESDGTVVGDLIAAGSAAEAKATFSINVSGYSGDVGDLRVVVFSAGSGTTQMRIYDVWVEGETHGSTGVTIQDGSKVSALGSETFIVKSTFTSDGSDSPTLKSVGLKIPDFIYKFSTLGFVWNDAQPLIKSVPGRTIRLNPESFVTEGSSLSLQIIDVELIRGWLLNNEYLKNLPVEISFGFYAADITEDDLVPYYSGVVDGYKLDENSVTLKLRDATKALDRKLPESTGEVVGTLEYDGTHLVDIVADLADRAGVLDRYIDSASFETVKADMGVGAGDPLPSEFIAYRTDNVVGGPDTLITKAAPAKKMVKELLELIGAYLVTQENGRLQMILVDTSAPADDEEDWDDGVIMQGARFDANTDETLRNSTAVYYDWDPDGKEGSTTSPEFGGIWVDTNAASILAWGQVNKIIETKWLAEEPASGYLYNGRDLAAFIAARETERLKNGVGVFSCMTTLDKLDVQVGDMVTVYSDLIISKNNPVPGAGAKMLAVKKTWAIDSGTISWELVEAT